MKTCYFSKFYTLWWLFLICLMLFSSCTEIDNKKEIDKDILVGNWYYTVYYEDEYNEYDSLYTEVYFTKELCMINYALVGPFANLNLFSYRVENDSVYRKELGDRDKEIFLFKLLSVTESTLVVENSSKHEFVMKRLNSSPVNLLDYLYIPDTLGGRLMLDANERMVSYFEGK